MTFLPNKPHRDSAVYTSDDGDFYKVPVAVLNTDEDADGETRYTIRLPITNQVRVVYEDELTPRPDAPATVAEQIEQLLTWGHPLLHAFVIEAILRYAEQIVENREQVIADMANSIVHGPAWVGCAEEAIKALKTA